MPKYIKTIVVESVESIKSLHVGQWIKFHDGVRGQWLGNTASDVFINRWQEGKFTKADAIKNGTLRAYAKRHGGK